MLHLVLCITVWTLIFTYISWRTIAIARKAVNHLQRLHQIPCNKCAYFTGDYRLKCTVHPTIAMSENAIGCRDFSCRRNCSINNSYRPRKYLLKRKLFS
jgi:hypothetical protein